MCNWASTSLLLVFSLSCLAMSGARLLKSGRKHNLSSPFFSKGRSFCFVHEVCLSLLKDFYFYIDAHKRGCNDLMIWYYEEEDKGNGQSSIGWLPVMVMDYAQETKRCKGGGERKRKKKKKVKVMKKRKWLRKLLSSLHRHSRIWTPDPSVAFRWFDTILIKQTRKQNKLKFLPLV